MNLRCAFPAWLALLAAGSLVVSGCSWTEITSDNKVDYRSQAGKTQPLEVPPDLTQLARSTRYQPQGGVVTASGMQRQAVAASSPAAAPTVAIAASGDMRVERRGTQRWLVTPVSPEQLWPQLRSFWQQRGFRLVVDTPEVGVMETDWAENRAKIQQDWFRTFMGKAMDWMYSSSERDRFRTRVERTAGGSEVYISHRGMVEVYTTNVKVDSTSWQHRPPDPELEAEMIARLMLHLGAREEVARATVAQAPDQPARARVVSSAEGAALEMDDGFDRAWRRVGLALDRRGFTVEDRDRTAGLYFVRYVDPKLADQAEPGFFSKLFGGSKDQANPTQRYRVAVKASGEKTRVSVQTSQGAPESGEAAKGIIAGLSEELK